MQHILSQPLATHWASPADPSFFDLFYIELQTLINETAGFFLHWEIKKAHVLNEIIPRRLLFSGFLQIRLCRTEVAQNLSLSLLYIFRTRLFDSKTVIAAFALAFVISNA